MERTIDSLVETFTLPPGFILLALAIGIVLLRHRPKAARNLLLLGFALFYLLSTPLVSGLLMRGLETYPALADAEIQATSAQAIVVLSAGRDRNAAEYGGDTVGPNTMVRCRYAARLHHASGLPVLASGGIPVGAETSLAQMMVDFMSAELAVKNPWVEGESRNTYENARYSARLLRARQIDTIFLVTQGWHMRRAVAIFESTGLRVIPAPTALRGAFAPGELKSWLPNARALVLSYAGLREIGAILWYELRY